MSPSSRRFTAALVPLLVLAFLSGCAGHITHKRSSSVVSYLYPDQDKPLEIPAIPRLSLPLHVGVAFVPEGSGHGAGFTETDKTRLLSEVAAHFEQQAFVGSIEILPSVYLRPGGGFENLDQLRTLHGIDVMVLVSYDQTQFTDEGLASITYWTLIGAYLVPGEKNDTHTMIDAVVYDIASRKLLFRAPGISHIKGRSTPVNLSEELRQDSLQGFQQASVDLVRNLDGQLALFKQRVKERPQDYQVVHRAGYTGAGSTDGFFLGLLLLLAGLLHKSWRIA
jgi:rhombotail lipoprotein